MAISSLDGLIAGALPPRYFAKAAGATPLAGFRCQTTWGLAGIPGAGSWNASLAGATLSQSGGAVNGALPFSDPAGGSNTYLARFSSMNGPNGVTVFLADRLWHNGGLSATSLLTQTIGSPTWPARDANGATAGVGVMLAIETETAMGASIPALTVSYTNSSGVASRTATMMDAGFASAPAGQMFRLTLQLGDVGVQSVQSLTLTSTWTSGTMHLVAYRIIASIDTPAIGSGASIDPLTSGLPQAYNGTVPYIWVLNIANAAEQVSGVVVWSQG